MTVLVGQAGHSLRTAHCAAAAAHPTQTGRSAMSANPGPLSFQTRTSLGGAYALSLHTSAPSGSPAVTRASAFSKSSGPATGQQKASAPSPAYGQVSALSKSRSSTAATHLPAVAHSRHSLGASSSVVRSVGPALGQRSFVTGVPLTGVPLTGVPLTSVGLDSWRGTLPVLSDRGGGGRVGRGGVAGRAVAQTGGSPPSPHQGAPPTGSGGIFNSVLFQLAVAVAIPVVSGSIVALVNSPAQEWYRRLRKPWWTPPDFLFGAAWSTLYALMGVASWLIFQYWHIEGATGLVVKALLAYAIQLGLNLAWPVLFFGLHRIDWALLDIAGLFLTLGCTTILFLNINLIAGSLMLPYLAWVGFASFLNLSFLWKNWSPVDNKL